MCDARSSSIILSNDNSSQPSVMSQLNTADSHRPTKKNALLLLWCLWIHTHVNNQRTRSHTKVSVGDDDASVLCVCMKIIHLFSLHHGVLTHNVCNFPAEWFLWYYFPSRHLARRKNVIKTAADWRRCISSFAAARRRLFKKHSNTPINFFISWKTHHKIIMPAHTAPVLWKCMFVFSGAFSCTPLPLSFSGCRGYTI